MSVDEIAVGPSLDASIDEAVFGREVRRYAAGQAGEWYQCVLEDGLVVGSTPYSRQVWGAFLVVEALRERGHEVHLISCERGWRAEVVTARRVYFSVRLTLPEAICRAALRAVTED